MCPKRLTAKGCLGIGLISISILTIRAFFISSWVLMNRSSNNLYNILTADELYTGKVIDFTEPVNRIIHTSDSSRRIYMHAPIVLFTTKQGNSIQKRLNDDTIDVDIQIGDVQNLL